MYNLLPDPVEDTIDFGIVHIVTGSVCLDQGPQKRSIITMISVTQDRDNSIGGLLRLVEGDFREQVVHNMVVNDVMEEVAADEAKVTINSGQSAVNK
jgi:hypothetical protein